MITFKQYLTEARQSLEELEHEIDEYLKAGEIMNPKWVDLKRAVDRRIEDAGEEDISKPHFWGKGNEIFNHPEGEHLYDMHGPKSVREVGMIPKRIAKIKNAKDHPIIQSNKAFHEKYKHLVDKMEKLKTMVVKTSAKRAEKKEAEHKAYQQTYSDSSSLVKVLEQHIDEYVKRAEEMSKKQFDSIMKIMADHGWDLDKIAPEPKTGMGREAYKAAGQKRAFYMQMTDAVGSPTGAHRKLSPKLREKHIERDKQAAHDSYMAWVKKMIQKIGGSVKDAEMRGSPWTGATLKVTKNDRETQTWVAKMIINRSKYNTLFNQFPTRRVDKPDSLE